VVTIQDAVEPVQDKSEHSYDLTAAQSRMARAALGLGVRDLAKAAGVSPDTVARLERGEDLRPATVAAIRAALEAAGVVFIPQNGGGPGVRLR
jgi:transcriptional regulator with XRE-family HTH domain